MSKSILSSLIFLLMLGMNFNSKAAESVSVISAHNTHLLTPRFIGDTLVKKVEPNSLVPKSLQEILYHKKLKRKLAFLIVALCVAVCLTILGAIVLIAMFFFVTDAMFFLFGMEILIALLLTIMFITGVAAGLFSKYADSSSKIFPNLYKVYNQKFKQTLIGYGLALTAIVLGFIGTFLYYYSKDK